MTAGRIYSHHAALFNYHPFLYALAVMMMVPTPTFIRQSWNRPIPLKRKLAMNPNLWSSSCLTNALLLIISCAPPGNFRVNIVLLYEEPGVSSVCVSFFLPRLSFFSNSVANLEGKVVRLLSRHRKRFSVRGAHSQSSRAGSLAKREPKKKDVAKRNRLKMEEYYPEAGPVSAARD